MRAGTWEERVEGDRGEGFLPFHVTRGQLELTIQVPVATAFSPENNSASNCNLHVINCTWLILIHPIEYLKQGAISGGHRWRLRSIRANTAVVDHQFSRRFALIGPGKNW